MLSAATDTDPAAGAARGIVALVPYTQRFVVPDASSSVLLVQDGAGWALPRVSSDEPEIVIEVAPTLRDLVGEDVFVLRDLRFGPMPPPDDAVVYVTERVRNPRLAHATWCGREEIAGLELADLHDRAALQAWFDGDEPASLQPWQREGWFDQAAEWIDEVLPGVTEVRQFATWCVSCIMRVSSPRGRSWCKAVPDHWAREATVTALLADLLPGMTPKVLALDAERGWMLLEDLDGAPADTLPVAERVGALEAMGEVHRAAAHLTDALLAGGCLDRRPNVLSSQIAALAEDPTVPLPDDLGERLRKVVPRLQELCDEMADAPIRPTLVHGDLHAGNLMRVADRFVVFDWSDACVADPFVDVLMFLTRLPDDEALRATCRERYLDAWPGLSRAEATRYVELAEPLAAMHHAVTYRDIYDEFGPDDWWLFEGALPRWIEHALDCPAVRG
jgi:aminoglycoside phosphotransferase (APT) family kinase protein